MNIPYTHESIRLTGRWDTTDPRCAVATAAGSYLDFAFEGQTALARFDIDMNFQPYLHLWIQLDGGDRIEAPIDSYLRVFAKNDGKHLCRIVFKGGTETSRRWFLPLRGKVSFLGIQVENPIAIPADNRRTIEFVGDSITEGVLIDADFSAGIYPYSDTDQLNRNYQDDACATYAWLTAEALDLRPVLMGYGAVGVTKSGCSGVPAAPLSYPYNFEGSPITHKPADFILINHGANDASKPEALYLEKYAELLDVIRAHNPKSVLISLSAFCGAFHEALGKMIADYNEKNGCHVYYIDSNGWIPVSPLHPLRGGHRIIASHLIPLMQEIIG